MWGIYCFIVASLFGVLRLISHGLHHMYDTSECIQETPSVDEVGEQNGTETADSNRHNRRRRKGALDQLYVSFCILLIMFLLQLCHLFVLFFFSVEEGIEMQVRNKQSTQTPPAGCSSRTSYTEPMAGSDDSIHSSAGFPALSTSKETGFKTGGSTIGDS